MLGVYDYTVILTYISLMVSIGGMLFSLNGDCRMALVCLAISGLCDMFDGKVARTKKDRTEVEKRFGIQIDSLADIVCFGVSTGNPLLPYGNAWIDWCCDPVILCAGGLDPSGMVQCF